jgi:hypothetical protein
MRMFRLLRLFVMLAMGVVCGCHFSSKPYRFAEVPDLTHKALAPPLTGVILVITAFKPDTRPEDVAQAIRNNIGPGVYPPEKMLSDAREWADLILSGKLMTFRGLPPDLASSMAQALQAAGLTVSLSNE